MSEFLVEVLVETEIPDGGAALLETAVSATLRQQQINPPATLTCLLTDDAHVQRLNRQFRQLDRATDVLSFPAGEPMPGMPQELPYYLGDVVVAVPYAARQAQAAGHFVMEELQLLVVHGVLHLLGHDHAEPAQKAAMWAAQTAVLTLLGLSHVTPTET